MKEKFYINAKVKKIDKDIKKALKKANIQYPHESLGFFKATYAKFEEANANKVILADSVKDDVKYLIGTQMNRDHERVGAIMGSIIDAYVTKDDEIEIVFTFAKNVYPEDYEDALELMSEDKLTVSFELMVDKDDVEQLGGGVRRLAHVSFDGVGLLFGIKPAYKNAYVLTTAMKIIEDAFKQENKSLLYASAKDITKKWTRIGELIEAALTKNENTNEGEINMDEKARKALLAKFKEDIISELGEEAVKDWSDEQWEEKLAKKASETEKSQEKEVAEETTEEKPVEETAEKTTRVVEEKIKTEETFDNETNETTVVTEAERTVKRDGKEVVKEKTESEITYTFAQVEAIKAEYEEKISFIKENATKIAELRAELGDFVKDLSDEDLMNEDKLENARLKKKVVKLEAGETVTASQEEEEAAETLETGASVETASEEEVEDNVTKYLKANYGSSQK